MLILPIFLTIVFSIMEMGNVAFQMILVNHATWEVARVGAMIATPPGGGNPGINSTALLSRLQKMLPTAKIHESRIEQTIFDRQAKVMNNDLVVVVSYPIPLIFPLSSFIMSKPKGSGHRLVFTDVRMPIERPLFQ